MASFLSSLGVFGVMAACSDVSGTGAPPAGGADAANDVTMSADSAATYDAQGDTALPMDAADASDASDGSNASDASDASDGSDGSDGAPPPPRYATSFEGACPNGWTLTGDWQCGVPSNVGPATAFEGTQCLGTKINANYSDLQTWAATTATSPAIDLSGTTNPTLTFRMWIDTEGSTYDGANLKISTDGGGSFTTLTTVTPAYPLMIAGQPAWGGHQAAMGWQAVQADLSAFAGQTVRLRFAFQSDSSGTFPGVYIDDLRVR